jgi:hypothetical protein
MAAIEALGSVNRLAKNKKPARAASRSYLTELPFSRGSFDGLLHLFWRAESITRRTRPDSRCALPHTMRV